MGCFVNSWTGELVSEIGRVPRSEGPTGQKREWELQLGDGRILIVCARETLFNVSPVRGCYHDGVGGRLQLGTGKLGQTTI